jgi:ketosteroid isomerase-like protein
MSESRKDVLLKALEAEAGGASADLGTLFTDDVVGWSPYASGSGLPALAELSALRESAFSNTVIMFRGLDEVGSRAFAEWLIEADHTGPLVLEEDSVLEATGRHIRLAGVTVADFREGKIRSFRTYFDDLSVIEQLVVGKVILAAATDSRPKLRYPAGPLARRVSKLRRFAPSTLFDKQIRKINQLNGVPQPGSYRRAASGSSNSTAA